MNHKMLIVPLILAPFALTSCPNIPFTAFDYGLTEDGLFRYVQVLKSDEYLIVDEYHYKEAVYDDDGNVVININIPETINGMPVESLGGQYAVEEVGRPLTHNIYDIGGYIDFGLVIYESFAYGSVFNINMHLSKTISCVEISSDLQFFCLSDDIPSPNGWKVNIAFSVDEENENFYSQDGELYYLRTGNKWTQSYGSDPDVKPYYVEEKASSSYHQSDS